MLWDGEEEGCSFVAWCQELVPVKHKIAVTVTAVFFSFVLRATYAVMLAISACAPPASVRPVFYYSSNHRQRHLHHHHHYHSPALQERLVHGSPLQRRPVSPMFQRFKLLCARTSYS